MSLLTRQYGDSICASTAPLPRLVFTATYLAALLLLAGSRRGRGRGRGCTRKKRLLLKKLRTDGVPVVLSLAVVRPSRGGISRSASRSCGNAAAPSLRPRRRSRKR